MKKLLVFLFMIFTCANINILRAETINMQWLNEDGTVYDTTSCTAGGDVILPTAPTKPGYTFMGWRTTSYTPIEYLESTGAQYINTEIKRCGTWTTVETKFSLNSLNSQWNSIYGAGIDFAFTINPILQQNSYQYGGYTDISAVVDTNVHVVKQVNGEFYIDGDFIYSRPSRYFTSNNNMLIFSRQAGDTTYSLRGKIYYFKLWKNGVLFCDMIPILDDNNVPCMYDRVTGLFFYNQGTGDFIAGPVVNQ